VICLFHILEVTIALVDLHTDMLLCFDDVTRVGYERNLLLLISVILISKRQVDELCINERL
jgi:hypothetical protein